MKVAQFCKKRRMPIYVALDVDDSHRALWLARETASYVQGFKIGPRLLLRAGPSIMSQLKPYGKIFLDLKFLDIPSTMLSATQSAFEKGADMVTIHACAGEEALKHLCDLEACLNAKRPFRILSVTLLTSFQQENLPPLAKMYTVSDHVESLANMVQKSGLKGLVCSGHEVAFLRQKHPSAYLLTPGIRLHLSEKQTDSSKSGNDKAWHKSSIIEQDCTLRPLPTRGDQKRVFTPRLALEAGANALVMGRPIYQAKDPAKVCVELQTELADFEVNQKGKI